MVRPSDAGEPMSSSFADHSAGQAEWRDTFAEICDRHRGRLIRWLTAIFGARDAEDIAQEALTRLFTRPGLVEESGDAWPWLAVVARNVGRDLARHNSWSTTVDTIALAHVPANVVVLDEVVARDEGARLARALRGLSPRERAVIRLRDFEGAPVVEIAELLGISENAVRQQLFRARRRLANVYVGLGGDSRIGSLVAAFGLRLRELARRCVPFQDLAPPSAVALAAVVPGVAALVAGALAGWVPGLGHDDRGTDATTAVALSGAWDERDAEHRHGTGRTSRPAAGPAEWPATHPDPVVDVHRDIPTGGHVDVTYDRDPLSTKPGRYNDHDIAVGIPFTPYEVVIRGGDEYPEGGGTLCQYGLARCDP